MLVEAFLALHTIPILPDEMDSDLANGSEWMVKRISDADACVLILGPSSQASVKRRAFETEREIAIGSGMPVFAFQFMEFAVAEEESMGSLPVRRVWNLETLLRGVAEGRHRDIEYPSLRYLPWMQPDGIGRARPGHLRIPIYTADRHAELERLNAWLGEEKSIFVLHGAFGMGKTHLAARFFQAACVSKGDVWTCIFWNFHVDPDFGNFLAMLFVELRIEDAYNPRKAEASFEKLFAIFVHTHCLIVLDGFDALLSAFADDGGTGSGREDFSHGSRSIRSELARAFVRMAMGGGRLKLLISSRMLPAGLENSSIGTGAYVESMMLEGLSVDDGLSLLRSYGVATPPSPRRSQWVRHLENPLLARILSAQYICTGRMDEFELDGRSHDLLYDHWRPVLRNVAEDDAEVFASILSREGEIGFDELVVILVYQRKRFGKASEVDLALTRLESLGLVGWNGSSYSFYAQPACRALFGNLDRDSIQSRFSEARRSQA